MGRKVCDTQRHLMDVFDLKKRSYIGTTSMESEVSLLMANQALASEGRVCYDPFGECSSSRDEEHVLRTPRLSHTLPYSWYRFDAPHLFGVRRFQLRQRH